MLTAECLKLSDECSTQLRLDQHSSLSIRHSKCSRGSIRNSSCYMYSVGFSACVLFNTPGPFLHLRRPGPGPLANPGGRYPTMDGKANTMAKPPDPIATSWPTTTILFGRSS